MPNVLALNRMWRLLLLSVCLQIVSLKSHLWHWAMIKNGVVKPKGGVQNMTCSMCLEFCNLNPRSYIIGKNPEEQVIAKRKLESVYLLKNILRLSEQKNRSHSRFPKREFNTENWFPRK